MRDVSNWKRAVATYNKSHIPPIDVVIGRLETIIEIEF